MDCFNQRDNDMMKRIFLAFLGLMLATPALAQGTWTTGPRTVTYTSAHTVGDGSDVQGGIPPAYSYEEPDYPSAGNMNSTVVSDWTTTMGTTGTIPFDSGDNKFRTHCNPAHEGTFDPLVLPGVVKGGHEHTFLGNTAVTGSSTYATLRTTGASTCAGGPLNRSAYWIPSMKEQRPSGVIVTRKPQRMTVYYTSGSVADANINQRIPRGFGYVGGKNPSNFNNAARRAEVPSGYTYQEDEGFEGWQCEDGPTDALGPKYPRLREANGTPSFQCQAGDYIVENLVAPPCWDGYNLRSPDAREHVRYRIRNNNDGKNYCPNNWYQLPGFRGIITWGPLEYDNQQADWWLSSDRMNPSNAAADPTSLDPCRQTGPYFCNGATGHFDWFGAWDYGTKDAPGIMLKWMQNCSGVTLRWPDGTVQASRPAACSDSTFIDFNRLRTNGDSSPDPTLSNNPVISFSDPPLVDRFYPVAPGTTGTFTIHHDHSSLMLNGDPATAPFMLNEERQWKELASR